MEKNDFFDFLNEMKEIIGSKFPADVRKELEEQVDIKMRMRRRIEAGRMIPMSELLRYNELCYKHFKEIQDIPSDICGIYQEDDLGKPQKAEEE